MESKKVPYGYYIKREIYCNGCICAIIFLVRTVVFVPQTVGEYGREYEVFCVEKKAVPEVLLKVVEAKRLLESGRATSVQEAAEQVDISQFIL